GTEDFTEPLDEERIDSIDFLRVYNRFELFLNNSNLYDDITSDKFGEPELYEVRPLTGGESYEVHESRLLRFDGNLIPDDLLQEQEFWSDSVYQSVYDRLRGLDTTYGNVEQIISEFTIAKLTIDNLQNQLDNGKENMIMKRLHILDMAKNLLNTILLDKEEEFERVTASLAGLEEAVNKLERAYSGVTGIPSTLLFGENPKGLNAGGEASSQIRLYYDNISARQEEKYQEQTERLVYLIMKSKKGPTKGQVVEDWAVEFNPLWQMSEKELAEVKKLNAETDKIYWEIEAVTADEITMSRFVNAGEYSTDTTISESHIKEIEEREKITGKAVKEGLIVGVKEGTEEDELKNKKDE
ncbi:hypothetical protein DRH27_03270, partial [Candidatus Falkowbacteria bacterium]